MRGVQQEWEKCRKTSKIKKKYTGSYTLLEHSKCFIQHVSITEVLFSTQFLSKIHTPMDVSDREGSIVYPRFL